MNAASQPCPDESTWERYLAGELDAPQEAALEEHLEGCPSCRDELALLAEWPSEGAPTPTVGRDVADTSRAWLGRIGRLAFAWQRTVRTDLATRPALPGFEGLEEIGRGGMGVVYRAHRPGTERPVAIKVFTEACAQFRAAREVKALVSLNHPNIVRIHDAGECEGFPYIVMEWVEGGDLAKRLADGPLPPREAAELARSLALAVSAAHEQGIVHRDIKPRNVLIAADGSTRLTDFGLARELGSADRLTSTGATLGTPGYMAPEQIDSTLGTVGPPADLHALGATLYAMLTGRPPFQAARDIELLRQIVDREPVSPRRLNDAIPRDLDTICRKCLEKQPARRYASAAALAADLERFLAGSPIHSRPPGPLGLLLRQARKHPLPAALAALTGALFVALIVGAGLFIHEQTRLRAIAEANTGHARHVLGIMAEGMESSSKAIRTIRGWPQPQAWSLFSKHLDDVVRIYSNYFENRTEETDWIPSEVQMLAAFAELCSLQERPSDAERLRRICLQRGVPLLPSDPNDVGLRVTLVDCATWIALAETSRSGPAAGLADFEQAYRLGRGLRAHQMTRSETFFTRSMTTINLAETYVALHRGADAVAIQSEELEFIREMTARTPEDQVVTGQTVEHLIGLAAALAELARPDEATARLDEADKLLITLPGNESIPHIRDVPTLNNEIQKLRDRLVRKGAAE